MSDKKISRRRFLKNASYVGGAFAAVYSGPALALKSLQPAVGVENPFIHYPSRKWEKLYRDIYKHDYSYTFMCTPNCTHNCYLKAHVKNGIVTRISPTQKYHKATDVYNSKASQRWDPRHCNKGLALPARFYGDRRVKAPMVRKGFLDWYKAGFPRDEDGLPPAEMFRRGEDTYVEVPWDEAYKIAAAGFYNTAKTYTGKNGAELLRRQDYDEAIIKKMGGAGTRAMKFRGGMPVLGSIKLFGQYRQANSMALLDSHIRKVSPSKAKGGIGFDNYTWHTDLPPGHPMVCGQQTIDFDLANAEYANMVVCWGMNWISTKMPDAHWLLEARLKGTKVVSITTEYSSTASKSDEIIVIRPGSDPAFALGLAHVIIKENLYDENFVKHQTDMPLLVRTDNNQMLKAHDIFKGYVNKQLKHTKVCKKKSQMAKPFQVNQEHATIMQETRDEWGDFVIWDLKTKSFKAICRDEVGKYSRKAGYNPAIEGNFEVEIAGKKVKVRTVFDLTRQHLYDTWTPEKCSKVTWAPVSAIYSLARQYAANPEKVLTPVGMGPNQMFNADQKDRAILLVAALTRNIGFFGGNVGSYAGNYRAAYFNGMPKYMAEDPFNIQTNKTGSVKVKQYFGMQSAHFYGHIDQPLKVHGNYFNGESHMPTPTKSFWFTGSNSILGNAKGHYEIVMNMLRHPKYRAPGVPKKMIDCLFISEWWWTGSCEYGDIIFAADSWAEYNQNDFTNSCTNPFMQVMPLTKIKRIHNTKADVECYKGVAKELAKLTNDNRFNDYWKFINKTDTAKPYIQRVLDHSNITKGYKIEKLLELAEKGIPVMMMGRTYPKFIGYEQSVESKPWYTKSGRLEFYRDEVEFRDYGESLVLHREPIDATFYEPNVIVAEPHPMIKPKTPEMYGWSSSDLKGETRQVRNVVMTPKKMLDSKHPLKKKNFTHIWVTPKFRHSVHTLFADLDILSVFFGPFGDMYRKDKRKPWVNEAYVDMNPDDAKEMGLEDGDYVWCDGDPEDRPFHGWQNRPEEYKVSRLMLRCRYYPGTPKGVTRSWFHFPMASFGTLKGAANRADGLSKNSDTKYQSMYRFGGHQSGTRSWLRPTLLTDTLVRKDLMGQSIGKGFCPDVHCANGAPRESFVKFTKAEDGGESGKGLWRPAKKGVRAAYESKEFKKYLKGKYTV